jgi:hypothetical protein
MNRTPKGSSYLSGVLDLLLGKPRKIKATTVRKSAAQVLGKQKQPIPAETYPYRAAEITRGQGACAAAIAISGKRLLLQEVPLLPLPDCTSRKCNCTYIRHKDRRSLTSNRRAEFSMQTRLYSTYADEDRRRRRGRRAEDEESVTEFDFDKWH